VTFAGGELRLIKIPALPKQRQSAPQPARIAPVAHLDRALPFQSWELLSGAARMYLLITAIERLSVAKLSRRHEQMPRRRHGDARRHPKLHLEVLGSTVG
jgi:hypothetical protein